ncbi:MAG: alpha/beta hydrolase [Gemmatimonadales bacterium]
MLLLALLLVADTSTTTLCIPVAPAETVAVTIAGQGEPVVFVPGLFGSAFGFRHVKPLFVEAGYQVVIVEPLGIGRSSRPRHADYSLTAQAARIAAVLDTLGIETAIVVAHSIGGSIAFRLAVQRPDLVAGIVSLEGGPAERATTSGFRFAMRFSRILRVFGGRDLIRSQVYQNLRASSGDASWVSEAVVDGYTAGAARDLDATIDAFKGMAESREPWTLVSTLARIMSPVRMLLGTAPHKSGPRPEEITLLRDSLPSFAVDSVPDVGHFIFEERPEAVLGAVQRLDVAPDSPAH